MNILTAFEWLVGNQAPTCGAIDLIAIKQADGTIKCSPFHVKLSKRKKDSKVVRVKVNGKDANLLMKIGKAGEAFFVERSQYNQQPHAVETISPSLSPLGVSDIVSSSQQLLTSRHNISLDRDKAAETLKPKENASSLFEAIKFKEKNISSDMPEAPTTPSCDKDNTAPESSQNEVEFRSSQFNLSSALKKLPSDFKVIGRECFDSDVHSHEFTGETALEPRASAPKAQWMWTWGDLPIKSKLKAPQEFGSADIPEHFSESKSGALEQVDKDMLAADSKRITSLITMNLDQYAEFRSDGDIVLFEKKSLSSSNIAEGVVDENPQKSFDSYAINIERVECRESSEPTVDLLSPSKYDCSPRFNHSTRMLSLCGAELSEIIHKNLDCSQYELQNILRRYAIPKQDFYSDPMLYVTNPDLVVLVNDALLPWSIAKVMFETAVTAFKDNIENPELDDELFKIVSLISRNENLGNRIMVTNESNKSSSDVKTFSIPTELPLWAGRKVSQWNIDNASPSHSICDRVSISSSRSAHIDGSGHNSSVHDSEGLDTSHNNRLSAPLIEIGLGIDIGVNDDFVPQKIGLTGKQWGINWELPSMSRNASSTSVCHFTQEMGIQDITVDFLSPYYNMNPLINSNESNNSWSSIWTWGDVLENNPTEVEQNKELNLDNCVDEPFGISKQDEQLPYDKKYLTSNADTVVIGTRMVDPQSADSKLKDKLFLPDNDNNVDLAQLSLLDINLEDICPGPARGDIYNGDSINGDSDTESYFSLSFDEGETGRSNSFDVGPEDSGLFDRKIPKYLYRKSLIPTQQQLKSMELKDGDNEIVFEVEGCQPVTAQLFLWHEDAKIVVADIEGVILSSSGASNGKLSKPIESKSLGWGSLFFSFGASNSSNTLQRSGEAHVGVTQLFHDVAKNGYKILYIATKSMEHSSSTKVELVKATAKSSLRLPPGPVFLSPDTLVRSLDPQRSDLFKLAALRGTKSLFPHFHNPFYAGFCTNVNDMYAFKRCGFPEGRIFVVDENAEIQSMNRTTRRSYREMHQFLNEMFPIYVENTVQMKSSNFSVQSEDTYSDFNFWKIPLPIVD